VTTIGMLFMWHFVRSHVGANAFSGGALTYGFQIAFYVLAGIALVGAVIAALMLESKPPVVEEAVAPDAAVQLEAAA
jgi:hypothetical protein